MHHPRRARGRGRYLLAADAPSVLESTSVAVDLSAVGAAGGGGRLVRLAAGGGGARRRRRGAHFVVGDAIDGEALRRELDRARRAEILDAVDQVRPILERG